MDFRTDIEKYELRAIQCDTQNAIENCLLVINNDRSIKMTEEQKQGFGYAIQIICSLQNSDLDKYREWKS